MEFFRKTHIDFMRLRVPAAIFSLLITIFSLGSLFLYGLNWGLDFTGGTEIQVSYPVAANLTDIRTRLTQLGFEEAVVQTFGSSNHVMIRVGIDKALTQAALVKKVLSNLPEASLQGVEFIGPQVGRELAVNGVIAILLSFLLTGIYIALRFEYRFAVSSTIALVHDPILILGIFSFFHIEFNLITLTALLTVIGYSLNDTIVVFDRVRENFRKLRKESPSEVVNRSVNETLSRTVMTSGLTLIVVVALFVYGGPVVHGFALALIIGILIGTYSSIYIAGSVAVLLGLSRVDLLPAAKTAIDDRP